MKKFTNSKNHFKLNRKTSAFICVYLWLIILCFAINAQTLAPGAPGKDAQWATAGKQGVGTSANLESKVWFTLAEGVMTEVYYPDVTTANVHLLQFVVVNPKTKKVETEQEDATHEIKVTRPDSLSFQQINTAKSGEWKIAKTYTTDVERDSVLIDVKFEPKNKDLNLYVYYDPSLANSGMGDEAYSPAPRIISFGIPTAKDEDVSVKESLASTKDFGLGANDGEMNSALMVSSPISEMTNGYYQTIDGIEQLKKFGRIRQPNWKAEKGNVVQMAKIDKPRNFTTVLSFAKEDDVFGQAFVNARDSREKGFEKCLAEYEKGWSDYVKTLPKVEAKYQAQFNMAAMVLKASEDKTVRGANVASLTIPWGGGANANEDVGGGYHLVWARDLYEVFTAYLALGDTAAANRALDFLFNIQQKPDGSFPQNSQLDGKGGWGSLQMDEVGYPLIMAYQLKRFDKQTYENHVKRAADFIVKNGPRTPQERWEEKPGYSPSTMAAEIAGLVCAAEIARKNNDHESANLYLKTADDWQANIEKWTATTNGKYGDGNYYVRLTANGKPDAGEKIELSNSSGTFQENEIVDAGFLELVRLGIKSPDDPLIQKSVKVVDEVLKVNTPNGAGFYRYNHDGYGEMDDGRRWNWDGKYTGKGRLWALLSGERGQYELAQSDLSDEKFTNSILQRNYQSKKIEKNKESQLLLSKAKSRLDAMLNFANEGLMIPEQIWDSPIVPKTVDNQFVPDLKFGEGTGSATPLAWSMAQFIRLAVNLQAGKNLDTPDLVYNRYVLGKKGNNSEGSVDPLIMQKDIENLPSRKNSVSFKEDCFSNWRSHQSVNQQNDLAESLKQSPIVWKCENGDDLAVLVYRGDAQKVQIADDSTNWKPSVKSFENYSDDGRVKIFSVEFAPTARVEYKLIVDGKWILDPLNPNKVDNGVGGENSFFTMPDYKPTSWDNDRLANVDGFGKVKTVPNFETLEIDSKIYGKRSVKVYLPANEKNSLPTLYLQDGTDYINRAKAIQIQYNLVAAGKIKPFIMVFVDYKDRMKEYWGSDDYAKYLATEVVPMVDKQYNTIKNRDGRAILGSSLGGVTSVYTALKYPEIFGRVGGQSSSFWIDNERVIKQLATLDARKTPFRFYFDVGTLEGASDDEKAVAILRGEGYDVTYEERAAGHNWTAWRDRLADAFLALWGS